MQCLFRGNNTFPEVSPRVTVQPPSAACQAFHLYDFGRMHAAASRLWHSAPLPLECIAGVGAFFTRASNAACFQTLPFPPCMPRLCGAPLTHTRPHLDPIRSYVSINMCLDPQDFGCPFLAPARCACGTLAHRTTHSTQPAAVPYTPLPAGPHLYSIEQHVS